MEKIIIFIIVALVVILLLTLFLYYNKVQELKNVQLYNCASSSNLYLKTSNFNLSNKYYFDFLSNYNFNYFINSYGYYEKLDKFYKLIFFYNLTFIKN